ncbi:MAG: WbqC family protein [Clostridium sp.]|nr:WbqC family protein [Clostridium sp.]
MRSPLIAFPERCAVLPPQYMGSAGYYATMAAYGHAVVDAGMRYDKRFKSAHRCEIASTHGRMMLTVPVGKDSLTGRGWNQAPVSEHGQWWSDHAVSLESAYGRTPFFEFYYDRIRPWLTRPNGLTIGELDAGLDAEIRGMLHLETEVAYGMDGIGDMRQEAVDDYRRGMPKLDTPEYYQVRADRLGFIAGLSVLDLIFNMGPEAGYVLKEMQEGLNPFVGDAL